MSVRLLVILVLLVVLSVSVSAGPAVPKSSIPIDSESYRTIGSVRNIDDRKHEFGLRDGRGTSYTVRADEAEFVYRDRRGSFGDLRDNLGVTIYGRELRRGIIDADVVIIGVVGDDYPLLRYEDVGRIITVRGEVLRVDQQASRAYMRSERGELDVVIGRETDIRELGRRRTLADLRPGVHIVVTGPLDTPHIITAHTVNVGGPDPGSPGIDSILSGVVTRDTGLFDRNLVVRTLLGEKRVEIPRGADVRIDGSYGSVHEIRRGDQIRAVGRWSGDVFVVRQLVATRAGDTELGEIVRISGYELTVRIDSRNYYVYVRNAVIRLDGRSISVRDLRVGDRITISGDKRGSVIYADRIDVEKRRR